MKRCHRPRSQWPDPRLPVTKCPPLFWVKVTHDACEPDGERSRFGWRPEGARLLTPAARRRNGLSTIGLCTQLRVRRLSRYDIECGTRIDEAFADFQGRDPVRALARVFAAVVHRRTSGSPDGTNNPFGLEGAGWIGFVGLLRDRPGQHTANETTLFAATRDGSRAAALLLQGRDFALVQVAYRSGDPIRLARAIEVSPLRASMDLTGLGDEVAGVRHKWWSVLADAFRFRHIASATRARPR